MVDWLLNILREILIKNSAKTNLFTLRKIIFFRALFLVILFGFYFN